MSLFGPAAPGIVGVRSLLRYKCYDAVDIIKTSKSSQETGRFL